MTTAQAMGAKYKAIKSYVKPYIFFQSNLPSTDEDEAKNAFISTRLYFVTLIVSLIVLVLYTTLLPRIKTITIKSPTIEQYTKLYEKYPQTLTCQCSSISVSYGTFIQLSLKYHQLCSSQFITEEWIEYLNTISSDQLYYRDFRRVGGYSFQLLSRLCHIVQQTINSELLIFQSTSYITPSLVSLEVFTTQTEVFIKQFQLSTINTFLREFNFIQKSIQGNGLMSGLLTNIELIDSYDFRYIFIKPSIFVNNNLTCSCDVTLSCIEPLAIYGENSLTTTFILPNFYLGCYIVNSLLQSTLECFFDQQCINQIQAWIEMDFNITLLNSSISSQYQRNTTIQELVDQLMIEQWSSATSYSSYYDKCHPTECTYSYVYSFDILYTISTLIALIGGLTKILRVIVPNLVALISRKTTLHADYGKKKYL
ncbi:unnamed protein product [Didymodactylos carnosus]|uniref:Uncharacterized protein n=1 Tax=Didymodactylos carnosus TaxID=1234261 RepID=A0A815VZC9_9BILA|nr:unnamed protein product [Didymodactylos carnosus]CAF4398486.1 unnamed protein product [Didymodactylos carnosus]